MSKIKLDIHDKTKPIIQDKTLAGIVEGCQTMKDFFEKCNAKGYELKLMKLSNIERFGASIRIISVHQDFSYVYVSCGLNELYIFNGEIVHPYGATTGYRVNETSKHKVK